MYLYVLLLSTIGTAGTLSVLLDTYLYFFSGRIGSVRLARPALRWREESGGGSMRDGEEVSIQAYEGDPDEARRVRIHQDARLSRGGYPEGYSLSNLK